MQKPLRISPVGKAGKYTVTLDRSTNASYQEIKKAYEAQYGPVSDSDLINHLLAERFGRRG